MKSRAQAVNRIIGCALAVLLLVCLPACGSTSTTIDRHSDSSSYSSAASSKDSSSDNSSKSPNGGTIEDLYGDSYLNVGKESVDPRWPTSDSELLKIPKSKRWYNASNHIGTHCTVVGPVANVHQAEKSQGQPIFVDIGEAYPSSGSVTLVIWGDEDWSSFSQMLTDINTESGCWVSVTGDLKTYKGYMQFNADDGVSFKWWTNVS